MPCRGVAIEKRFEALRECGGHRHGIAIDDSRRDVELPPPGRAVERRAERDDGDAARAGERDQAARHRESSVAERRFDLRAARRQRHVAQRDNGGARVERLPNLRCRAARVDHRSARRPLGCANAHPHIAPPTGVASEFGLRKTTREKPRPMPGTAEMPQRPQSRAPVAGHCEKRTRCRPCAAHVDMPLEPAIAAGTGEEEIGVIDELHETPGAAPADFIDVGAARLGQPRARESARRSVRRRLGLEADRIARDDAGEERKAPGPRQRSCERGPAPVRRCGTHRPNFRSAAVAAGPLTSRPPCVLFPSRHRCVGRAQSLADAPFGPWLRPAHSFDHMVSSCQRCGSRTKPISRVSPVTTSGASQVSNTRIPSGSAANPRT